MSFSAPATTWLLVSTWPLSSMTTPEPSEFCVWIATTDGATASVTASQSGAPSDELDTGASSAFRSVPTSASDDALESSNAPVAAAVPRLASSAAPSARTPMTATSAPTAPCRTGSHTGYSAGTTIERL